MDFQKDNQNKIEYTFSILSKKDKGDRIQENDGRSDKAEGLWCTWYSPFSKQCYEIDTVKRLSGNKNIVRVTTYDVWESSTHKRTKAIIDVDCTNESIQWVYSAIYKNGKLDSDVYHEAKPDWRPVRETGQLVIMRALSDLCTKSKKGGQDPN
jgi:hypothetical protein